VLVRQGGRGAGTIRIVSAETVCVLLRAGASDGDVEGVLSLAFERGKSLGRFLSEQGSPLAGALERELSRGDFPTIELVRPLAGQLGMLPPGLCQRLAAVPVHRDARSGRVDVAVLDPLDQHVLTELEFHLEAPVRLLRAREEALLPVLATLAPNAAPSGPPLPLLRKAPLIEEVQGGDEPVLSLSRAKPEKKITEPIAVMPGGAAGPASVAPETRSFESDPNPAPPPSPTVPMATPALPEPEPVEDIVSATERAGAAEELVALLLRGMVPAPSVVLSVRAGTYSGRAASPGLPADLAQKIKLAAGTASVVETAVRTGLYLGALPHTPAHQALRELFGADADAEVYVVPVLASGHPTLVLVSQLAKLGPSVSATGRADTLARAVGRALERIVMSKKRGV
jgi:hypothetical protein